MDSATSQRLSISLAATLSLILIHLTLVNSFTEIPTAYEVLEDYNFPVGLFQKSVYEGGYRLKYEPTIKGYISNGKISSLEGVSVMFFHKWRKIVEILRRDNHIHFSAGVARDRFHIKDFEECPQCVCSMNCFPTS
ncbi:hypothetical protein CK203_089873 [Vitis vinifera]|uniref:Uncharacterized protein n=1 Tax=Vitis vinifera TaxID=29760 RepID=A0A438FK62_VITVI|nr:hypothetical protein CK203_089873 [Vitis vinifera]